MILCIADEKGIYTIARLIPFPPILRRRGGKYRRAVFSLEYIALLFYRYSEPSTRHREILRVKFDRVEFSDSIVTIHLQNNSQTE